MYYKMYFANYIKIKLYKWKNMAVNRSGRMGNKYEQIFIRLYYGSNKKFKY